MELVFRVAQIFVGATAVGVYLLLLFGTWPPPNVHGHEWWLSFIWSVLTHAPILAFSLFVCVALHEWKIIGFGMILVATGIVVHFVVFVLSGHANSIAISILAFAFELGLFGATVFWLWRLSTK